MTTPIANFLTSIIISIPKTTCTNHSRVNTPKSYAWTIILTLVGFVCLTSPTPGYTSVNTSPKKSPSNSFHVL